MEQCLDHYDGLLDRSDAALDEAIVNEFAGLASMIHVANIRHVTTRPTMSRAVYAHRMFHSDLGPAQ
jgi:hypothetical protein